MLAIITTMAMAATTTTSIKPTIEYNESNCAKRRRDKQVGH